MNSSQVIVSDNRTNRADPRFFGVPTEEMLLDLSWIRQDRLDTLDDTTLPESTRANTLAHLEHRAAPIIQELKRRHEQHLCHQGTSNVEPWPTAERYAKVLELAHELKSAIPLSTYIYYAVPGVKLKKTGDRWKGQCPYPDHHDNTPSFVVFDDRRFTCFGCDRSGDIYAIVALVDDLDRFTDQVQSLAVWAGKATGI